MDINVRKCRTHLKQVSNNGISPTEIYRRIHIYLNIASQSLLIQRRNIIIPDIGNLGQRRIIFADLDVLL